MTLRKAILIAMEQGRPITRASWRSAVVYIADLRYPGNLCSDPGIRMSCAGKEWRPAAEDVLAEDWMIAEPGRCTEPQKAAEVQIVERRPSVREKLLRVSVLVCSAVSLLVSIAALSMK